MNTRGLNKTNLQIIAVIAMILDHTAFLSIYGTLIHINVYYILFYFMHFIGRMTIVIMCYFIAEGYYKTSNVNKYIIRMGIFAVISQIPFYLNKLESLPEGLYAFMAGNYFNRNVIFTLFIALCLLVIIKRDYHVIVKAAATAASLYLVRCSDWGWACLAWVLAFALLRDKPRTQMLTAGGIVVLRTAVKLLKTVMAGQWNIIYIMSAMIQLGGLLSLPLLRRYNGEKGNAPGRFLYIFYPLHLIILYIIKLVG